MEGKASVSETSLSRGTAGTVFLVLTSIAEQDAGHFHEHF